MQNNTVNNCVPNLATNWITILSPATAHLTSNARSSYSTSQFNFDWERKHRREEEEKKHKREGRQTD